MAKIEIRIDEEQIEDIASGRGLAAYCVRCGTDLRRGDERRNPWRIWRTKRWPQRLPRMLVQDLSGAAKLTV